MMNGKDLYKCSAAAEVFRSSSNSRRGTRMTILNYPVCLLLSLVSLSPLAVAAPVNYIIDPDHTHPLFEADHYGLSVWRGLFKHTSGTIVLDAAAAKGFVNIDIDVTSVDFGNDKLNDMAVNSSAPPILEAAKYPVAHYQGALTNFTDGAPGAVAGELTLHGVTKPVTLRIDSFKCLEHHPVSNKEVCGADATATFNRADFGIKVGQRYGLNMEVTLRIQVEAIRAD
jgi:polyisoprenoid-binding protein YceI